MLIFQNLACGGRFIILDYWVQSTLPVCTKTISLCNSIHQLWKNSTPGMDEKSKRKLTIKMCSENDANPCSSSHELLNNTSTFPLFTKPSPVPPPSSPHSLVACSRYIHIVFVYINREKNMCTYQRRFSVTDNCGGWNCGLRRWWGRYGCSRAIFLGSQPSLALVVDIGLVPALI